MSAKATPFDSQALQEWLGVHAPAKKFVVGFSGGADSTALLTALYQQRENIGAKIEALHFNHGLHPDSKIWQQHCEEFCRQRDIAFTAQDLDLSSSAANLEDRARELRYGWVQEYIDQDTVYSTAHNADDRAETFLLNALRGSGIQGLTSIPEIRALGRGQVARPLLCFSHSQLTTYLQQKEINWVEDPSNTDCGLDRNFIRHQIIPLLETRWPAARKTLARTAEHVRSSNNILRELLTRVCRLESFDNHVLPCKVVDSLGPGAGGLVVREWLRRHDTPPIPEARLGQFLQQLSDSTSQSSCEVAWADWSLRLFHHELWLSPPGDCPECPQREWNGQLRLELGPAVGAVNLLGDRISDRILWTVGPRQQGDNIQLHIDGPRRKLKKIFQEQPIPPWHRGSIPVLYCEDETWAIGDWTLAPKFETWLAQNKLEYQWQPESPGLRETRLRCHDAMGRNQPA